MLENMAFESTPAWYGRFRSWLWIVPGLLVLLSLVLALSETGWQVCPPIDDTLIYCQYAREMASGNVMAYGPGEAKTTGATSLLYLLSIVPVYLVGFDGDAAVFVIQLIGALLLSLTVWTVVRVSELLGGWRCGLASGGLCCGCGHLVWHGASGMDTVGFALVQMLAVFTLLRAEKGGSWRSACAFLFIACAYRPEGIGLGLAALVWWFFRLRGRVGFRYPLCGVIGALAPLIVAFVATGAFVGQSVAAKSMFASSRYGFVTWLGHVCLELAWVVRVFLAGSGLSWQWPLSAYARTTAALSLPPGALVLCVVCIFVLFKTEDDTRGSELLVLWPVVGVCGIAAMLKTSLHWNRYLVAYLPAYIVLVGCGLAYLASLLDAALQRSRSLYILLALCLALQAPSLGVFVSSVAVNSREIAFQHKRAARWISSLPKGTCLCSHDAGALRYFDDNRDVHGFVDVVGLTHPRTGRWFREGEGALWRRLLTLNPRPILFLAYPQTHNFDGLGLATAIERFPVLGASITNPGRDSPLVAYRLRWDLWGERTRPWLQRRGWDVMDRVVVGDLASESFHDYWCIPPQSERSGVFITCDKSRRGVWWETGRSASSDGFSICVRQWRPVELIVRLQGGLDVEVVCNGASIGLWGVEDPGDGRMHESSYVIAAERVDTSKLNIELRGLEPPPQCHLPVRYWACQPVRSRSSVKRSTK